MVRGGSANRGRRGSRGRQGQPFTRNNHWRDEGTHNNLRPRARGTGDHDAPVMDSVGVFSPVPSNTVVLLTDGTTANDVAETGPARPEGNATSLVVPDGCAQLVSWDGGWAPPPVDFDSRPVFDKPIDYMWKWLDDVVATSAEYLNPMPMSLDYEDNGVPTKAVFTDTIDLGGLTVQGFKKLNPDTRIVVIGEIAPRYWIPEKIEHNLNANTFWEYFRTSPPMDCDYADSDLATRVPWWQKYPGHYTFFMPPVDSGETLSIDLEREGTRLTKLRRNDKGSEGAIKKREEMLARKRKKEAAAQREIARDYPSLDPNSPDAVANVLEAPLDSSIKPAIDLVVRRANDLDVDQLCEIYNHYVDRSCVVPDAKRVTKNAMLEKIKGLRAVSLPFLVAARQRTKKIVGFIYCDDYNDERGLFRFTAELEMFTRAGFERKGVAKVLMDQVLSLLDPDHAQNCGKNVETEGEFWLGKQRRIKSIIIHLAYPRRKQPQWLFDWLVGLGWRQMGVLDELGYKDSSVIDLAILQRMTGERINKNFPPHVNY